MLLHGGLRLHLMTQSYADVTLREDAADFLWTHGSHSECGEQAQNVMETKRSDELEREETQKVTLTWR